MADTNEAADLDLEGKVAELSTRLLEVMEKNGALDTEIKTLRRELDACQEDKKAIQKQVDDGVLIDKSFVEEERRLREAAETEATRLRGETLDLTDNLFDEANKLVANAKRETAEIQKRNDQLQAQIVEKDTLLEAMQEQLVDLKKVLQDVSEVRASEKASHRVSIQALRSSSGFNIGSGSGVSSYSYTSVACGVGDGSASNSARSSIDNPRRRSAQFNSATAPHNVENLDDMNNDSLFSPIRPVQRYDLPHNQEFLQLINGSIGKIANQNSGEKQENSPRFHFYKNGSLKEFAFFKKALSDDIEPTLRLDIAPGISWLARRNVMSAIIDGTAIIEPIVSANERGFYGHRDNSSSTSVGSSTVAAESRASGEINTDMRPVATAASCAFCGEDRGAEDELIYARLHNFKTNKDEKVDRSNSNAVLNRTLSNGAGESKPVSYDSSASLSAIGRSYSGTSPSLSGSAMPVPTERSSTPVSTGHPLCHWCLNRVRAVCDFIAFIKKLRDGVWKATDQEGIRRAWDECERLRERMFFARMGSRFAFDDYLNEESESLEKENLSMEPEVKSNSFETKDDSMPMEVESPEPDLDESRNSASPEVTQILSVKPVQGEAVDLSEPSTTDRVDLQEETDDEDEFLDSYADHDDEVVEVVDIVRGQEGRAVINDQ